MKVYKSVCGRAVILSNKCTVIYKAGHLVRYPRHSDIGLSPVSDQSDIGLKGRLSDIIFDIGLTLYRYPISSI
jgi:hypothetical protein